MKTEDPNQVDEVPEQAADLDLVHVSVVVLTERGAQGNDQEVNHAREHVKAGKRVMIKKVEANCGGPCRKSQN